MSGLSSKRQRESDELVDAHESVACASKKPCPSALETSSNPFRKLSSTEDRQTPPWFNLPTLTPAESSDEDDGRHTGTLHKCSTGIVSGLYHASQTFKSTTHLYNTEMEIDSEKDIQHQINNELIHTWPAGANHNGSIQPPSIPHPPVNYFPSITEQTNMQSTYEKNHTNTQLATMVDRPFSRVEQQENQRGDPIFKENHPSSRPDQDFPSPISDDDNVMICDKFPHSDIEMASGASRSASPALLASQAGPRLQQDAHSYQRPSKHNHPSINTPHLSHQLISQPNAPSSKKKVTLSMGFRADCDKCLHKVPGHYSHIIRT